MPGGGIEEGEDVLAAIKRELIEETGIAPDVGNLLYVHQIKGADGYGTPEFIFHIKNGKDYIDFDITKTTRTSKKYFQFMMETSLPGCHS